MKRETHVIGSSLKYVPQIDTLAHTMADKAGLPPEDHINIAIALTEIVKNAMVHGNGLNPEKNVRITFAWDQTSFLIEVEDEGNGFNPDDVPDPTAPENLLKDNGRGLFVSRQLLDDVRFEKAGNGKGLKDFDVAPFVSVAMNDDLDAAYDSLRPWLALYIGGMGAKDKNFYNDYATRLGYGDAAKQIQELYLSGKKQEAEALVPNELLDEVALVGPRERIIERLGSWKEAGKRGEVGTMLLGVHDTEVLELFAKEML